MCTSHLLNWTDRKCHQLQCDVWKWRAMKFSISSSLYRLRKVNLKNIWTKWLRIGWTILLEWKDRFSLQKNGWTGLILWKRIHRFCPSIFTKILQPFLLTLTMSHMKHFHCTNKNRILCDQIVGTLIESLNNKIRSYNDERVYCFRCHCSLWKSIHPLMKRENLSLDLRWAWKKSHTFSAKSSSIIEQLTIHRSNIHLSIVSDSNFSLNSM